MMFTEGRDRAAIPWWAAEPQRWERDRRELSERFPELEWEGSNAGSHRGVLPLWPFSRPEPACLTTWTGTKGLDVHVVYGHAYPMVPPRLFPLSIRPEPLELTQTRWHVMGDGALCLLRDHSAWTGRESVVDLLLKAAGWRVEYALMKHKAITQMSDCGIVEDDRFDDLLAQPAPILHDLDCPGPIVGGPQ